jgi:di/tricarboxylate transporter
MVCASTRLTHAQGYRHLELLRNKPMGLVYFIMLSRTGSALWLLFTSLVYIILLVIFELSRMRDLFVLAINEIQINLDYVCLYLFHVYE